MIVKVKCPFCKKVVLTDSVHENRHKAKIHKENYKLLLTVIGKTCERIHGKEDSKDYV